MRYFFFSFKRDRACAGRKEKGRFYVCRGCCFWQNVHSKKRAMRKSKERIQRSTSRLSTLFLKWSRKEKKSRDERKHESVMDRERVKEETASRGDRERDRERQERERERERERDRET